MKYKYRFIGGLANGEYHEIDSDLNTCQLAFDLNHDMNITVENYHKVILCDGDNNEMHIFAIDGMAADEVVHYLRDKLT